MAVRCHDITCDKYAADKVSLQGLSRPLQPNFFLRRSKYHAFGRNRTGFAHFDLLACPDTSIGTLQAVKANQFQTFIFGIGVNCAGGSSPFANDFDHVALLQSMERHELARKTGETTA